MHSPYWWMPQIRTTPFVVRFSSEREKTDEGGIQVFMEAARSSGTVLFSDVAVHTLLLEIHFDEPELVQETSASEEVKETSLRSHMGTDTFRAKWRCVSLLEKIKMR
jgi:hypothetical protein